MFSKNLSIKNLNNNYLSKLKIFKNFNTKQYSYINLYNIPNIFNNIKPKQNFRENNLYHFIKKEFSHKTLFDLNKKKFCTNDKNNTDKQNLSQDEKNNLLQNLDTEFEKLLEKSDNTDIEKRIKLLSIKLLQANTSKEIINIYEEKYIKNLVEISSDEVILILYFYTSYLDKETNYDFSNKSSQSIMKLNFL